MTDTTTPPPERAPKTVEVRMLRDEKVDGKLLPCNTVQALDKGTAASLVSGGAADDSPAAVRACYKHGAMKKDDEVLE